MASIADPSSVLSHVDQVVCAISSGLVLGGPVHAAVARWPGQGQVTQAAGGRAGAVVRPAVCLSLRRLHFRCLPAVESCRLYSTVSCTILATPYCSINKSYILEFLKKSRVTKIQPMQDNEWKKCKNICTINNPHLHLLPLSFTDAIRPVP